MLDLDALKKHYQTLSDAELLNLRSEGGFADEALPVLSNEMARRHLSKADIAHHITSSAHNKLTDEAKEKGMGGRGPGLLFFGRRYLSDADKDANIQVRTKFFTLGGLPLIPIASYRFKCKGGRAGCLDSSSNRQVLERIPLDWSQVFITWAKTVLAMIGLLALIVGYEKFIHK
jgi:hypothetical protein